MISIIKFSIHFNKVFQHRGGRWVTIYTRSNPTGLNGKVIKTNPVWATIQRADNQRLVRVWNFKVNCVAADHHLMSKSANIHNYTLEDAGNV